MGATERVNSMKMSFNIEEELYKSFKKTCVDRDVTMTAVILRSIEEFVKTNKSAANKEEDRK